MKKIVAIIPSRYQSSRFPGKPLAMIHGKPMIQWVYEKVSSCKLLSDVYVATDDERIYNVVQEFGGKVILTSNEHQSGTDRLAEAVQKVTGPVDIVANIQGDEPMIKIEMIEELLQPFEDENVYMTTLKKEIFTDDEINNPNIAKLITDANGDAIYFSRSTIPYNRDNIEGVKYYKHIGVYAYTKDFLLTYSKLPQTPLELSECLEQLRVIENGYKIRVVETQYDSVGVDLEEHIQKVEALMKPE